MNRATVSALVTPQWRAGWNEIAWDQSIPNGVPNPSFLTFVMKASQLRKLSGVFRRSPKRDESRALDESIQRAHEAGRSREIRRFVELGYPMSNMTTSQLSTADPALRRPGWLPTAVVVNVLREGETRDGLLPVPADQVVLAPDLAGLTGGSVVELLIPKVPASADMHQTPAFEVIDGQHRLWAFEDDDVTEDYFLPVVAFVDLSKSHQAYLFWSINIKPKKINTSLAFDLYPILRSQEWLMKGEGLKIYRESRAQELTEAMWASPESPWYDRINMIGSTGVGDSQPVTQASFVRSLLASFVKPWSTNGRGSAGLFGTDQDGGLDWNRAQQAAFLVAGWQELFEAIESTTTTWFGALKDSALADGTRADPIGRYSMLGSDQGVRVVLLIWNDLAFRLRDELNLREWQMPPASKEAIDPEQVDEALQALEGTEIRTFLKNVAQSIAKFDWRTAKAPGIDPEDSRTRAVYRGSGGYVALRRDIYGLLVESSDPLISAQANAILQELKEADGDIE